MRTFGARNVPHWSMVTLFWSMLVILAVVSVLVLLFLQKPVWVELETVAVVIGTIMTIVYTYILYHGVRFIDENTISLSLVSRKLSDIPDVDPDVGELAGLVGQFTSVGVEFGIVGFIVGLLFDIAVLILLTVGFSVLVWFGVNLILITVMLISLPLFYIFKQSISYVMQHASECYGSICKSFLYGLFYAAVKTAMLCLMIYGWHELVVVYGI